MPRPRFLKLDIERRTNILEAAKAEFAERGFEQSSYNRIIEHAGLSKGAMYYYFDDKLDLYVTVLEAVNDEMVKVLGIDDGWVPEGDFWEAMTDLAIKSWDFAVSHPELAALVKSIQSFPMKSRKEGRLGELFDVWRSLLEKLLEYGRARGQVRTDHPISLLVEVTVALDEAIDFWLFDNMHLFAGKGQEQVVEMVLDFYKRLLAP
jgi:AcrR family transcriptional regulator